MSKASAITFVRLDDGTILERGIDGSFRPVRGESDVEHLKSLSDSEIEAMAESDPDHPALDDDLLAAARPVQASAITLDPDVLAFFKQQEGRAYETRINAVLRSFVDKQRKAG